MYVRFLLYLWFEKIQKELKINESLQDRNKSNS
uniref:Uncharacterized protein n=1 Tax=Siphoviridae sp. ctHip2 TaxID=2827830 RepID=A0A8S5RW63_9CAUD|nr:MAG TPA: hypothetical protein [Siphoviridae sp. ctHip2]